MYYAHEQNERKVNVHPMCTELPPQSVDDGFGMKAADYLTSRKLSKELAKQNGWYLSTQAGDEYPRIVIPAITHKAGHVYWQARDISGTAYIRYQSPKGPRHEALVRVLPRDKPKGIVILEGPCCALAAAGQGYIGYALMGMMPSQATMMHLALLIQDNPELNALVLLDRDSGNAAVKIVAFLASQGYKCKWAMLPGPEKDLAECLPSKRRKFLSQNVR